MRNLKFFFFVLILGICQAVFLDYFKIFNVKPDLLLISVIIVSLVLKPAWAVVLSLFAGIFKDTFASCSFINTFLFPLWSFFIIKLSSKLSFDELPIRMGLVFIVAIVHNIFCALIFICSGKIIPPGIILRIVIVGAFYTAIVFLLVSTELRISNGKICKLRFEPDARRDDEGVVNALR
ncbi:MAG: hypothetical protein QMD94_02425 [Candidatus Omnitrophota bacterium]|nr:hypothetical protein [Candidatus Omnitrophota bacterium]